MAAIDDNAGAKVKAVLDKWEAAWNASDMNAMWQLATDDIHWVNVVGMHWRGKAEVQKAHQVFFDQLFSRPTLAPQWVRLGAGDDGGEVHGALIPGCRAGVKGKSRPSTRLDPPASAVHYSQPGKIMGAGGKTGR